MAREFTKADVMKFMGECTIHMHEHDIRIKHNATQTMMTLPYDHVNVLLWGIPEHEDLVMTYWLYHEEKTTFMTIV